MKYIKRSSNDIDKQDRTKRKKVRKKDEILDIMKKRQQTMTRNGTDYKALNSKITNKF